MQSLTATLGIAKQVVGIFENMAEPDYVVSKAADIVYLNDNLLCIMVPLILGQSFNFDIYKCPELYL